MSLQDRTETSTATTPPLPCTIYRAHLDMALIPQDMALTDGGDYSINRSATPCHDDGCDMISRNRPIDAESADPGGFSCLISGSIVCPFLSAELGVGPARFPAFPIIGTPLLILFRIPIPFPVVLHLALALFRRPPRAPLTTFLVIPSMLLGRHVAPRAGASRADLGAAPLIVLRFKRRSTPYDRLGIDVNRTNCSTLTAPGLASI